MGAIVEPIALEPSKTTASTDQLRSPPGSPPGSLTTHRIGRYEIRDLIGCGGFSVVYEGYDPADQRRVAIKVCDRGEPDDHQRFHREAAIGRHLAHPNVTAIYDFGRHEGTLYLVQEYLPGEDLSDLILRRDSMELGRKLEILVHVARGLAHAHSNGVLHRDLKPSNIRLLADGRVKIMDFGSAKRPNVDGLLTEIGTIIGTVAYLAPECMVGEAPSASSDIFAFGVIAYELLAFRRPFAGHNLPSLIREVVTSTPTPLARVWPDCPPELAEIVESCLRREPVDRCRSALQLEGDLERLRA